MHSLYRRIGEKTPLRVTGDNAYRDAASGDPFKAEMRKVERRPMDGSVTKSDLLCLVIPINEELMIARETDALTS